MAWPHHATPDARASLPPARWSSHPQPGSKVVCVEDGLPTWVCEVMAAKPTLEEAVAFVKEIESGLQVPIDPLPPPPKHALRAPRAAAAPGAPRGAAVAPAAVSAALAACQVGA